MTLLCREICSSLREGVIKKLGFLGDLSPKFLPPPLKPFREHKKKKYRKMDLIKKVFHAEYIFYFVWIKSNSPPDRGHVRLKSIFLRIPLGNLHRIFCIFPNLFLQFLNYPYICIVLYLFKYKYKGVSFFFFKKMPFSGKSQ